jgi:SAM-dependent methyltransferase
MPQGNNHLAHRKLNLLNVGCGAWYHPDWVNVDLKHSDSHVVQHDIVKGLPFHGEQFDAVYHSHVLEHLSPDEGVALMRECFRVLKPGGILRIVVPDLEQIARLYLQQHDLACQGNELAKANYEWMKLELIDQMVRRQSGGGMGQFITSPMISNPEFVLSRLGNEFNVCLDSTRAHKFEKTKRKREIRVIQTPARWLSSLGELLKTWRLQFVINLVGLMLGKKMQRACEEGFFRSQGEIHRWMYDRYSLNLLAVQCGFQDCAASTAFESRIDGFNAYQLDTIGERVRKPDSLFFECAKPLTAAEIDAKPAPPTVRFSSNHSAA